MKGASVTTMRSIVFLATIVGFPTLASVAGFAQDKAPCRSFQKLTDGTWQVVSPIKIETDKGSGMLSPGTAIKPGKLVAGVDIYAALQKSCSK
jgi:hypothetical protein